MMKKTIIPVSVFLWILLSSFYPVPSNSVGDLVIPQKKINKTITKLWNDKALVLQEADLKLSTLCLGNSRLFTVRDQSRLIGFVDVGRVNSCRSGGCSIDAGDAAVEFEYFDYFFVTDTLGKVLNVKVYNYRATHGHEIMSRGWLRQFIGYSGKEKLLYGKDIEAISGATVSVNAIIEDIQMELNCLRKYLSEMHSTAQNKQALKIDN